MAEQSTFARALSHPSFRVGLLGSFIFILLALISLVWTPPPN